VTFTSIYRYHDGTKHRFNDFARSLGYLDWASQPRPFRAFHGAAAFSLFPAPSAAADGYSPAPTTYDQLFDLQAAPRPLSAAAIGDLLRHALGLSAWKRFDRSRWSLRVNPSSGNLHPTEAYLICGAVPGLAGRPAVYHYAADRHALELRCIFDEDAWSSACGGERDLLLVALTSIHWREAWKYGERAFRYCQHDLGHAMAAVGLGAALVGWRASSLPTWPHQAIAALTGVDRDDDFVEAEREEPGCLLAIAGSSRESRGGDQGRRGPDNIADPDRLIEAVRRGRWSGRASQLSEDHVEWTFIDEIARATRDSGHLPTGTARALAVDGRLDPTTRLDAREIMLQRRSAVAFDGHSTVERSAFYRMLSRVMPVSAEPWQVMWWTPRIHLAIFVHRVNGVAPGL
jgi:SagB-type dehydrogenase family enzyme